MRPALLLDMNLSPDWAGIKKLLASLAPLERS